MDNKLILDNQFLSVAFSLINSAKRSLFISSYKFQPFNSKKNKKINILFNAICNKSKEGVTVSILLNKEQPVRGVSRFNIKTALQFKEENIKCRFLYNSRCCHSKIILVDGLSYYVGSHNFTEYAVSRNFETGLHGDDSVVSRELRIRTAAIWSAAIDF